MRIRNWNQLDFAGSGPILPGSKPSGRHRMGVSCTSIKLFIPVMMHSYRLTRVSTIRADVDGLIGPAYDRYRITV